MPEGADNHSGSFRGVRFRGYHVSRISVLAGARDDHVPFAGVTPLLKPICWRFAHLQGAVAPGIAFAALCSILIYASCCIDPYFILVADKECRNDTVWNEDTFGSVFVHLGHYQIWMKYLSFRLDDQTMVPHIKPPSSTYHGQKDAVLYGASSGTIEPSGAKVLMAARPSTVLNSMLTVAC